MPSLSDFQVDRQIFEARFPRNFLFWDRSGQLWTELGRALPEIKIVLVDPNHTQFEAGDFYLAAEPGTLRITAKDGVPFDRFEEKTATFFRIAVEVLEVELFERLGFRTLWIRQCKSMMKAAEAFREFGLLSEPDGKSFRVEEQANVLEAKMTWEGVHTGVTIALRTEKRRVDLQIPWDLRSHIQASSDERFILALDVDNFTRTSLQRGQVDVREWISSANRLLKKGLAKELFND